MFYFENERTQIIKNTLSASYFNGINYYIKDTEHFSSILYYSEAEYIDDETTSFLFINQLPKGNYAHYIYIKTIDDEKTLIAKMQNQLLTAPLPGNTFHFLTNVIPDIQSLGNIIKLASHIVNNPIMLSTAAYEIIEMYDNHISFKNHIWDETARTGVCPPTLVEQFESSGITEKVIQEQEPVLWSLDTTDDCPKITSKIMYQDSVIAYLSVFLVNQDSMDDAFSIVKELVPLLSSILSKSSCYISDHCQMTRNLVSQLIEGETIDMENVPESLNLHLSNYRIVCVTNKHQGTIYNYNYYLNILLKENIIGTFYKGKLLLLVENQEHIDQYLKVLQRKYFSSQYYLFVSEILFQPEEMSKMVSAMLHFSNYAFENESIIFIRDYLHILYVPAHDLYHPACHRLDLSSNKDLKETLIQYIEHNLNVTETADALFIHRNTLFYRLNKITNDYGIDTSNYLDLTNFYIYYLSTRKRELRQPLSL